MENRDLDWQVVDLKKWQMMHKTEEESLRFKLTQYQDKQLYLSEELNQV